MKDTIWRVIWCFVWWWVWCHPWTKKGCYLTPTLHQYRCLYKEMQWPQKRYLRLSFSLFHSICSNDLTLTCEEPSALFVVDLGHKVKSSGARVGRAHHHLNNIVSTHFTVNRCTSDFTCHWNKNIANLEFWLVFKCFVCSIVYRSHIWSHFETEVSWNCFYM